MPRTSLFVLSDLHAADDRFAVPIGAAPPPGSPGRASWLNYAQRQPTDEGDPMLALLRLVREARISADFLVIPGDICDKANGDALRQAWQELDQLRLALGASATIATAGNHDLDSRYRANAYDPRAALIALTPLFPLIGTANSAEYWAYGVTETQLGHTRFLVVNSCAYHGGRQQEMDHGRIGGQTLARLQRMVSEHSAAAINVLLCHHHPYPFPGAAEAADDRMLAGEDLIACLDESPNEWLIIHGHRHMARLMYAAGNATSPAVLAAGSAAVRLDPPLSALTRNQVHLVTAEGAADPAELCGTVDSWNYVPGIGWDAAGDDGGLPRRCGFGYRGRAQGLATRIADAIRKVGGPLRWADLLHHCRDIEYLTPHDFQRLREYLPGVGVQLVATGDATFEAASL